jgi:hypothetical protein
MIANIITAIALFLAIALSISTAIRVPYLQHPGIEISTARIFWCAGSWATFISLMWIF